MYEIPMAVNEHYGPNVHELIFYHDDSLHVVVIDNQKDEPIGVHRVLIEPGGGAILLDPEDRCDLSFKAMMDARRKLRKEFGKLINRFGDAAAGAAILNEANRALNVAAALSA